ncbi:MAG TPA: SpoIIE family protein phosphatase [Candidatus Saccharimonadales bacterium]|nr:SpoIIE family protein phosphatase [Candidatus Saccharimonadales bacterium]
MMAPTTPRRTVLSIRWIVAISAAVLTTLVVLGVMGVMVRRTRDVLIEEIDSRLLVEAKSLALAGSRALLTEYPELTLAPLVKEMSQGQPELAFLAVADRSGTIQGHPDVRRIGTALVLPPGLRPVRSTIPRGSRERLAENAEMFLVSVPILDPNGRVLGTAFVGVRRSYVEQAVGRVGRRQYVILAAFLSGGVLISLLLMSVLLRPIGALRAGMERIGRGDLGTPVKLTDRTEFGLLADAINEMSSALKTAQGEMVERARLAKEMDLAREIQRSLLPAKQTVAGDFVIDGEQWAATEVGGDYFDVLPLADGKIGIAVADVSGKGLAGCLVTSMLYSLLRAYHTIHVSPRELLTVLDERLGQSLKRGSFVTMFYGVLDPESGRLVYSSAGHNPALLYRGGERRTEWLRSSGIPLGSIRGGAVGRSLEDSEVHLGPGDVLVQFTDGINETQAPATQEQFGFDRMEGVIRDAASQGARGVLTRLHTVVEGWRESGPPDDDETVLVVSREGMAAETARILTRFADAERQGAALCVPADLGSLSRIGEWLDQAGVLAGASEAASRLLNLALYEVCANIAEHGCGDDPTYTLDIFWTGRSGQAGSFFVRDQGKPFRPVGRKALDVEDRNVRTRGRGFGLEIIHRAMTRVGYYPETRLGNITVLEWDPVRAVTPEKELRHA